MSQATLLPTLTLNRHFVEALIAQEAPCCALGLVEEHGQPYAVLALRPGVAIPSGITDQGFKLGHALLGGVDFELIQFSFEFYGFGTYNLLLNPSNPLVRSVVRPRRGPRGARTSSTWVTSTARRSRSRRTRSRPPSGCRSTTSAPTTSTHPIRFEFVGRCADRYGVSLTVATLRWLDSALGAGGAGGQPG